MRNKTIANIFIFILLLTISSCSKDDNDEEPVIYNLVSVDGKMNGEKVSIKETNEDIDVESTSKSSNFDFRLEQDKVSMTFCWTVKLKETADTTVTLHLVLHDVNLYSGRAIHSPNLDKDSLPSSPSSGQCYLTVKCANNDSVVKYCATNCSQTFVSWRSFLIRRNSPIEKKYGVIREYKSGDGKYPGITGHLVGGFVNENDKSKKINLDMEFTVY